MSEGLPVPPNMDPISFEEMGVVAASAAMGAAALRFCLQAEQLFAFREYLEAEDRRTENPTPMPEPLDEAMEAAQEYLFGLFLSACAGLAHLDPGSSIARTFRDVRDLAMLEQMPTAEEPQE